MSAIQIDNGYLIISANAADADCAVSTIDVSYGDAACEITFATEREAKEAMDQLADALCGKWLYTESEKPLS